VVSIACFINLLCVRARLQSCPGVSTFSQAAAA
jgi:hypothetical protein